MAMFLVQARDNGAEALQTARTVSDRFSWPAFLFAQVWLLFHRLWIALVVWIVLEACFLVFVYPHVSVPVAIGVDLLARVFLGLEASRLRTGKGARAFAVTDVVVARGHSEAETRFFRQHEADGGTVA